MSDALLSGDLSLNKLRSNTAVASSEVIIIAEALIVLESEASSDTILVSYASACEVVGRVSASASLSLF